ncbi:Rpn family recombination-promoting nuclease/putative transposase [Nocardia sp. NPDC051833]|uniref:Rpn family recombination-promoting nuclease/putative transposase n=1 Tax=Nocardia sp. NPDC051833 TaxID=3155674 RepID=UPI00342CC05F
MTGRRDNPHDSLFRGIMGEPAYAASELRSVLPERLSAWLDWSTLRKGPADYVTEEMRVRFGDLLFEIDSRDGAALIYVAMEHQSSSDELMPFRMLEYLTQIWARHLRMTKPRPRRLPVIIPLVVHIGSQGARWCHSTQFADLFELPPSVADVVGDYLPRFRFMLDDVTALDAAELAERPLVPEVRLMLNVMKAAPNNSGLDSALAQWTEDLAEVADGADAFRVLNLLVRYIMLVGETEETALTPLFDGFGPEAKEALVTAADRLRAEGELRGRAEGEARGEVRGVVKTLLNQLQLKFGAVPAAVVETVRAADPEDLNRWVGQILTADTIEETLR